MTERIKNRRSGIEYLQLDLTRLQKMRSSGRDNHTPTSKVFNVSLAGDDLIIENGKYAQLDITKLQMARCGDQKSVCTASTTMMDDDDSTIRSVSFHRTSFESSSPCRRNSLSLSQRNASKPCRKNSTVISSQSNHSNNMSISAFDISRSNRIQSHTSEDNSIDQLSISLSSRSEKSTRWHSLTADDGFFVDPLSISRRSERLAELPREIEFSDSSDDYDDYCVDPLGISRGSTRIRELPREIEFSDDSESDYENCNDFL